MQTAHPDACHPPTLSHGSPPPNSPHTSQFLFPPCRLHPASMPTTGALSLPLTTEGHCQDHSSHLGTCPSMSGCFQPQPTLAKLFYTCSLPSVHSAWPSRPATASSSFSSLSSLHKVPSFLSENWCWFRRGGWCSGTVTHWRKRTFILVLVLPAIKWPRACPFNSLSQGRYIHIHHGGANYGPCSISSPLPSSVNSLLRHSHVQLLIHYLWLPWCDNSSCE